MFERAIEAIKKYDRIIIHRHKFPDGDAIGSQVGLKNLIKDNFPNKEVYVVGDENTRLPFMKDCIMDEIPDEYYNGALAFILDCGSAKLICDERYKNADLTIRLDHHIYCEDIADIDYVESTFESCCGMVALLSKEAGFRLSSLAAESIYTGMITDSGRFMFDSTSARTFELAAYLISAKFDVNELYYNLYSKEFDKMLEEADNIHKIKFTKNNVAYIITTKEELAKMNSNASSVSSGLVSIMRNIKDVYIWANFTESEEEIRVELRSNRYNINRIAVKYNGGGHKKASGATIHTFDEVYALLNDLDELAGSPVEEE